MRIALIIFLLCATQLISRGQNYYTVIAKNGLIVRSQPSINSERVGALNFNQNIQVLKTERRVTTPPGQGKSGKNLWALIKLNTKETGYVLYQHLLKNYYNPDGFWNNCIDDKNPPDSTYVSFKKFSAKIPCYSTIKNCYDNKIRKDSVYLCEDTFYETSNKILEIIPRTNLDSVVVFYTAIETIDEQVNWAKVSERAKKWSAEQWYKNTVHWKGMNDYQRLEGNGNFFRLPIMNYQNLEKERKQKLALRDTLVDLSGEADNIAKMVYKGKPCLYSIESVILKIYVYPKNAAPETRYIKIYLSYGC